MKNKKGITLIAVILLMTLLAITSFSLITFVAEKIRLASARENEINAFYMAQAGIHYGIYRYRRSSSVRSGTYVLYPDRGFTWDIPTVSGSNITITSTGYSPKTGSNQIQKQLIATYNTTTRNFTSIGYN